MATANQKFRVKQKAWTTAFLLHARCPLSIAVISAMVPSAYKVTGAYSNNSLKASTFHDPDQTSIQGKCRDLSAAALDVRYCPGVDIHRPVGFHHHHFHLVEHLVIHDVAQFWNGPFHAGAFSAGHATGRSFFGQPRPVVFPRIPAGLGLCIRKFDRAAHASELGSPVLHRLHGAGHCLATRWNRIPIQHVLFHAAAILGSGHARRSGHAILFHRHCRGQRTLHYRFHRIVRMDNQTAAFASGRGGIQTLTL